MTKVVKEFDSDSVQVTDYAIEVSNLPEYTKYKSEAQLRVLLTQHLMKHVKAEQ